MEPLKILTENINIDEEFNNSSYNFSIHGLPSKPKTRPK